MMIRIHPSAPLPLLLPLFGLLSPVQLAILWGSAILHELGHVICYRLCGSGIESVTLIPIGLAAVPKTPLHISPRDEIFCALSGPAVNLILALLFLALPLPADSVPIRYLLYCNLALAITNLLPVLPLDGGRVLYYTMALRFPPPLCETVCRRCAVFLLIALSYSAGEALILDGNPSFALIWGYLLLHTALYRGAI